MKTDWVNGRLPLVDMDDEHKAQFFADVISTSKWLQVFADTVVTMTAFGPVKTKFYAVPNSDYTVVMLGEFSEGKVCKVFAQKLSGVEQQYVEWKCLSGDEYMITGVTEDVSLIVTVFKLIDAYKYSRYLEIEGFA